MSFRFSGGLKADFMSLSGSMSSQARAPGFRPLHTSGIRPDVFTATVAEIREAQEKRDDDGPPGMMPLLRNWKKVLGAEKAFRYRGE
jgi:hypothetical protein